MNRLIDFFTNPYIPMLIGAVWYVWIFIAWFVTGRPYFAISWLFYALAGIALVLDGLQIQGRL